MDIFQYLSGAWGQLSKEVAQNANKNRNIRRFLQSLKKYDVWHIENESCILFVEKKIH